MRRERTKKEIKESIQKRINFLNQQAQIIIEKKESEGKKEEWYYNQASYINIQLGKKPRGKKQIFAKTLSNSLTKDKLKAIEMALSFVQRNKLSTLEGREITSEKAWRSFSDHYRGVTREQYNIFINIMEQGEINKETREVGLITGGGIASETWIEILQTGYTVEDVIKAINTIGVDNFNKLPSVLLKSELVLDVLDKGGLTNDILDAYGLR